MEVRKMNSHDLRQFRDIFDEEMTREGFVWRYQMYMHVDFEQYWLIGLWPKVANIGYDFSIQFTLNLFNALNLESLKAAHSQYYESMFIEFNMFDDFDLSAAVENYKCAYEQYVQKVKPVFHRIHSSYDAYQFRNQYCKVFNQDSLPYPIGESCIEYLLFLNKKEEIPEVLNKMKKGQNDWEDYFYTRRPLPWNPASKYYQQEWEDYWREKLNMEKRREDIKELERKVMEDDYGDMAFVAEHAMQSMADTLRKSFTKKERDIMEIGWKPI